MILTEAQKRILEQMENQQLIKNPKDLDADTYLLSLRAAAQHLAQIVHKDQRDRVGKQYICHLQRVAERAQTVFGYCLGLLHDVIEDGRDTHGITKEFLIEHLYFPKPLVDAIDVISRREGEDYSLSYLRRVLGNYIVTKTKIDDAMDNCDPRRYHFPTAQDIRRCSYYLRKVGELTTDRWFQEETRFDYVHELQALASLTEGLECVCMEKIRKYEISNLAKGIETPTASDLPYAEYHFYFGYQGHQERSYTLRLLAYLKEGSRKHEVLALTYPSSALKYRDALYKPRALKLVFDKQEEAMQYMLEARDRITKSEVFRAPEHESYLIYAWSSTVRQEDSLCEDLLKTF